MKRRTKKLVVRTPVTIVGKKTLVPATVVRREPISLARHLAEAVVIEEPARPVVVESRVKRVNRKAIGVSKKKSRKAA
jgi:hypothetical protein